MPAPAWCAECPGVGWPMTLKAATPLVAAPSHQLNIAAEADLQPTRLPPVDLHTLLMQDAATLQRRLPPRVGISRDVSQTLQWTWRDAGDGARIATATLQSPDARHLRVRFTEMNLPPGAALYIYPAGHPEAAAGPYAESGPRNTGRFWSPGVPGDTATLEYYLPQPNDTQVPFRVDQVAHIYRPLEQAGAQGGQSPMSPLDCMGDVACYADWEDISYAVARIVFYVDDPPDPPGWHLCTGTLLATETGDLTPYFLTSAHCIDEPDEAESIECRWFYQHATCGGSFMTSRYSYDADLLATSGEMNDADWSLLLVKGVLPPGVFWSGWTTADPSSGAWSVAVHHPDGSWKRYSRGQRYAGPYWDFHQLRFNVAGAVGHIYYGSSGSGIFRESDQLLFGNCSWGPGEPGCDNLNTYVYYGRFSSYYSTIAMLLLAGSDDSLEQNDDCPGATILPLSPQNDLVVKSTDEDWHSINLDHSNQLTVNLSFSDPWGNIDAELYDACDGSVVASVHSITNDETLTYVHQEATSDLYLRVYLVDDTRNTYNMQVVVEDDVLPPTPDPMTFALPPTAPSTVWVTMSATAAADVASPPVEYYFEFNSGGAGGNDSGWQSETDYVDDGLQPDTQYCYRVKARDSAAVPNETAYSSQQCVTTPAVLPGDFDFDGDVDIDDHDAFANCFTGPGGGPIGPTCEPGDFDADTDIDCDDRVAFEAAWTSPNPPPYFPPCPESCGDDADCNDADVCTDDQCDAGACSNTPIPYGDTTHNGTVNLLDIFCILDGIAGDFSECSFENDDIHPCRGDGALNLFDVFAALDAIGGIDPCCSTP